jgi:hypothetical protein
VKSKAGTSVARTGEGVVEGKGVDRDVHMGKLPDSTKDTCSINLVILKVCGEMH